MSMKKGRLYLFLLLLVVTVCACSQGTFAAKAKNGWVTQNGKTVWMTKNGVVRESTYYPSKGMGIVKVGSNYYCYKKNGKKYTGFFKTDDGVYFFNSKKKGCMVRDARVKISKKYYVFDKNGKRVQSAWVNGRYYGANGAQVFSKFVGDRYVTKKGKMATGAMKIKKKLYYFDPNTGFMLKNAGKAIKGTYYYFNDKGVGSPAVSSGVTVEPSFYTDPQTDDKTLLASIIYCEAGNQPYYGQVAVGLVIMNRVKSASFPNKLKEVIYAKDQFEPCRNDTLTRCLNGSTRVTDSCKKAAAEAISRASSGKMILTFTEDGKEQKADMTGYLFFMTPKAYKRLGIKSEAITLKGHMFFKVWKR